MSNRARGGKYRKATVNPLFLFLLNNISSTIFPRMEITVSIVKNIYPITMQSNITSRRINPRESFDEHAISLKY